MSHLSHIISTNNSFNLCCLKQSTHLVLYGSGCIIYLIQEMHCLTAPPAIQSLQNVSIECIGFIQLLSQLIHINVSFVILQMKHNLFPSICLDSCLHCKQVIILTFFNISFEILALLHFIVFDTHEHICGMLFGGKIIVFYTLQI